MITATDKGLTVTGEDHTHLYELYCEDEQGETFGPFTLVATQYEGTWRHGSRHLLVVEVDGYDGLWGTEVQQQDGDEPWSSLDPASGYDQSAGLAPVEAVQTIKYRRAAREVQP